jgi:hypothetical protein
MFNVLTENTLGLSEPRKKVRTHLLVSPHQQFSTDCGLLRFWRVGGQQGLNVFRVVRIQLGLYDFKR